MALRHGRTPGPCSTALLQAANASPRPHNDSLSTGSALLEMACSGQAGRQSPQPSQRPPSSVRASSVKRMACRGQARTQAWQLACSRRAWTQRLPSMLGMSIKFGPHGRYSRCPPPSSARRIAAALHDPPRARREDRVPPAGALASSVASRQPRVLPRNRRQARRRGPALTKTGREEASRCQRRIQNHFPPTSDHQPGAMPGAKEIGCALACSTRIRRSTSPFSGRGSSRILSRWPRSSSR